MGKTRDQIVEFSRAFKRPVNTMPTGISVSDRILLGKLLLEETVEYVTKGLGLTIRTTDMMNVAAGNFDIVHHEGGLLNIVECADGLGDVNVVAHFNALWHGFNLDEVTTEIHRSNMSKLDDDGKPIINEAVGTGRFDGNGNEIESLMDPSKPAGKVLKSANFREPDLIPVINAGNLDLIQDQHTAPPCVNHPYRESDTNLDGDHLCQECADNWVRGEGDAAAEREQDVE